MKFKNIGNAEMSDVYGYRFRPGEAVEVVEPNLIRKFQRYGWLEAVDEQKSEHITEDLSRDELKARADELGIEYFPRIKTPALAKMVEEYGRNENTAGE